MIPVLSEEQQSFLKFIAALAVLAVIAVAAGGWVKSCRVERELKSSRATQEAARKEAAEAIKTAAEVAEQSRAVVRELKELEGKKDEQIQKLDSARARSGDLRSDYQRAVTERVSPDAVKRLCDDLADLGYPC